MDNPPGTISYADFPSRRGIVHERSTGGVRIIVPALPGERAPSREQGFLPRLVYFLRIFLRGRSGAPRYGDEVMAEVIIELDTVELSVTYIGWAGTPRARQAWPRHEIGELRANRYSNGIYLRVPGKQNLDLLPELDPAVIQWIGGELERAISVDQST